MEDKRGRQELCWLVYVNLIQARAFWEEGITTEKMLPRDQPVEKPVVYFLD